MMQYLRSLHGFCGLIAISDYYRGGATQRKADNPSELMDALQYRDSIALPPGEDLAKDDKLQTHQILTLLSSIPFLLNTPRRHLPRLQ